MSQLSDDDRARLHEDHAGMLAAFEAKDGATLLTEATRHHEELRRAVESLPADPALYAPPDG
jgi:hypothetical protein